MERTGVSVVIITHNEEEKIADCLRAILALHYSPMEIVVVDASEDGTGDIVNSIGDARLKYICADGKGYSRQRNIGVRLANYPIVAFTDADCYVPLDWLETLTPLLSDNVVAVGGNAYPPKGSRGFGLYVACLGFPAGGAIGLDANLPGKGEVMLATCNAIFHRDQLLNIGGFDEMLEYGGEDTAICRKFYEMGYQIKYEPESFVYHRTRGSLGDFARWCIRRGKAQAQLSREKFSLFMINTCMVSGLMLLFVIFGLVVFNQTWLALGGVVLIYYLGTLALFLGTRKFQLAWVRRRRMGIKPWQLLTFVPALFWIRRELMAIGGIVAFVNHRAVRARLNSRIE